MVRRNPAEQGFNYHEMISEADVDVQVVLGDDRKAGKQLGIQADDACTEAVELLPVKMEHIRGPGDVRMAESPPESPQSYVLTSSRRMSSSVRPLPGPASHIQHIEGHGDFGDEFLRP